MIEHSFNFGESDNLVGTFCLPAQEDCGRRNATAGIVLFNAGIVPRIGPHRINVSLAHALARQGIPSIRFDLSGLGDSARASGETGFEDRAVNNIRSAMTHLAEATGLQRFGLFGFCSGAFHSYNTAHVDERVASLMLFDAYRYPTLRSRLILLTLRFRQHDILRTAVRLTLQTLAQIFGRFIPYRAPESGCRVSKPDFIVGSTSKASFAEGARRLLDRGVDVSTIYAGDGLEVHNYARQFNDAFKRFGIANRVTTTFLPNIDHVATGKAAQAELISHLLAWSARVADVSSTAMDQPPPSKQVSPTEPSCGEIKARPEVIVLSRTVTGLATVRCLGKAGIGLHAIYFEKNDPVRLSRYCRASYFTVAETDEQALLDYLIDFLKKNRNFRIIVPTCDVHALLLARNRELLRPYCEVMAADLSSLTSVISKNSLHAEAAKAGLNTIPGIVAPGPDEIADWSAIHPAPYLIKPFYVGVPGARIKQKNLIIGSREALLDFVSQGDMQSLIVQRVLFGGDGYVFDCYGYANKDGEIISMASKRRWRQHLPDYGTCTMGEIPANLDMGTEAALFENTRMLFRQIRYHGIFGVEWLFDRSTSKFYIIDFNARPTMGIGHVLAAGLNLPALAYSDLVGDDISGAEQTPRLKHLFGIDLLRDIESFRIKRQCGALSTREWLISLGRCRYFYYTDLRDPLPGIARTLEILRRGIDYLGKMIAKKVQQKLAD